MILSYIKDNLFKISLDNNNSIRLFFPIKNNSWICYGYKKTIARRVSKYIYIADTIIRKGKIVIFRHDLCNYYLSKKEHPFEFNPYKDVKPLSFGMSPHHCLGIGLSLSVTKYFTHHFFIKKRIINILKIGVTKGASAFGINSISAELSDA